MSEPLPDGGNLPDGGEYAVIAMRYKNRELGFAMKPENMEHGLIPSIQSLRQCVIENADLQEKK